MKLSLVSLIPAALAAIAGTMTIATPGPLHVRALEDVNSSERDIDVYSRESGLALLKRDADGEFVDGLFIRVTLDEGSELAAQARKKAAGACIEAAEEAEEANRKAKEIVRKTNDAARTAKDAARKAARKETLFPGHAAHYRKLAFEHREQAKGYTKLAAGHAKMAIRLRKAASHHTTWVENHREDASALRANGPHAKRLRVHNWERSLTHADNEREKAGTRSEESGLAITRYDIILPQRDATIAAYHDAIARYGSASSMAQSHGR